jgi:uncharacterized Zn finger protein (UPF0148 family)
MKQIVCEMCGGKELVKQDGVFVCQSCGIKYSVEEVKKMMVEIGTSAKSNGLKIIPHSQKFSRANKNREIGNFMPLKGGLALRKRIEKLERKNQKLEQKLKLKKSEKQRKVSKLPINTRVGTFDKNSRSMCELFGNTPTDTPKVQGWVDFMRNEIKAGKRSTNWKGMLYICDILQHHTYRVRCASEEIRSLASVWTSLPLAGKEEKVMPKQEKNIEQKKNNL